MSSDERNVEVKWERKRVQRVIDYHNEKYGTHIEIIDKSTDIYADLQGKFNWDWVCYDRETGDIAVEVKRVTTEETERKANSIHNLLHEVRNSLSGKLSGDFILFVSIDADYDFPFKKQPKNKILFKDAVYKAITESVQTINVGEKMDLQPQISEELSFELPITIFFDLYKRNSEGNALVLELLIGGSPSGLDEFEQLVSHANEQLKKAGAEDTFLVLIEEGYNPTDPSEIAEALRNIEKTSYSEIKHVYFIRGNEIVEIPLSNP